MVQKQGAISRRKTTNEIAHCSSYIWKHKEKMDRNNPYGSFAQRVRKTTTFAYAKDAVRFGSQYMGVCNTSATFSELSATHELKPNESGYD